jgi:hypothetical protein
LHEEHLESGEGEWLAQGGRRRFFYIGNSLVPVGKYQPGLMSLATAGFDPRAFIPGSYYEPGLKVQNEPGLMGSRVLRPKKQWGPGHQSRFIVQPGLML